MIIGSSSSSSSSNIGTFDGLYVVTVSRLGVVILIVVDTFQRLFRLGLHLLDIIIIHIVRIELVDRRAPTARCCWSCLRRACLGYIRALSSLTALLCEHLPAGLGPDVEASANAALCLWSSRALNLAFLCFCDSSLSGPGSTQAQGILCSSSWPRWTKSSSFHHLATSIHLTSSVSRRMPLIRILDDHTKRLPFLG